MKRIAVAWVVAGLVVSASAEEITRRHFRLALEPEVPVRIEVGRASLKVEPGEGSAVETELTVRCTGQMAACEAAAENVSVATFDDAEGPALQATGPKVSRRGPEGEQPLLLETQSRRSSVRTCSSRCAKTARAVRRWEAPLLRTNRWNLALDLVVRVPTGQRLEIQAEEGNVDVLRLASNAVVRLGRGSVKVTVHASRIGNVRLAAKDGRAWMMRGGPRPVEGESLAEFDSYIEHSGKGPIDVDVEVERGDVTLELM